MASPSSDDYKAYIDQIIEATRSGTMAWTQVNPTTFVWEIRGPQAGRLTLQRVARAATTPSPVATTRPVLGIVSSYVLQVTDLGTNENRLVISSEQDEILNKQFETLYGLIRSEIARKNLDFLKSLIPPKSGG